MMTDIQEFYRLIKKKVKSHFNLDIDIDEEENIDPYLGKMP